MEAVVYLYVAVVVEEDGYNRVVIAVILNVQIEIYDPALPFLECLLPFLWGCFLNAVPPRSLL